MKLTQKQYDLLKAYSEGKDPKFPGIGLLRRSLVQKDMVKKNANELTDLGKKAYKQGVSAGEKKAPRKAGRPKGSKNKVKPDSKKTEAKKTPAKKKQGTKKQEPEKNQIKGFDNYSEFLKWFNDSEIVDENGDPLVLYHGTDKIFDNFKAPDDVVEHEYFGKYLYFTKDPIVASFYGKSVIPVYLKAKDIKVIDAGGKSMRDVAKWFSDKNVTKVVNVADANIRGAQVKQFPHPAKGDEEYKYPANFYVHNNFKRYTQKWKDLVKEAKKQGIELWVNRSDWGTSITAKHELNKKQADILKSLGFNVFQEFRLTPETTATYVVPENHLDKVRSAIGIRKPELEQEPEKKADEENPNDWLLVTGTPTGTMYSDKRIQKSGDYVNIILDKGKNGLSIYRNQTEQHKELIKDLWEKNQMAESIRQLLRKYLSDQFDIYSKGKDIHINHTFSKSKFIVRIGINDKGSYAEIFDSNNESLGKNTTYGTYTNLTDWILGILFNETKKAEETKKKADEVESEAKKLTKTETENEKTDMVVESKADSDVLDEISLDVAAYKNAYEINQAIRGLIDQKGDDPDSYTLEEKKFIGVFSGYGGLDKYNEDFNNAVFTEFYTPDAVARKMYALAYKHGFDQDGVIYEPSAGAGVLLKYAPYQAKNVIAVEMMDYSAKILKILYPEAEVINDRFESLFVRKRWTVKGNVSHLKMADLVIGNPPYGEWTGREKGMGEKSYTKARNIVEYFIFRGLDLLKPGGLLIYLEGAEPKNGGKTFLQSSPGGAKPAIAQKADLVEAYRMPTGIFERTDCNSEIIILRKK